MKQARFYITISLIAILVLSVARVVVTNTISTNGIDLGKIQSDITDLKKENAYLHEQVLKLSSLTHVASVAAEEGFILSRSQTVLTSPLPLALKK